VHRSFFLLPIALPALAACHTAPLDLTLSDADVHAVDASLDGSGVVTCASDDDTRSLAIEGTGTLRGLLAGERYQCRAEYLDGSLSAAKSVRIPDLPSGLPIPTLVSSAADDAGGYVLVNVFDRDDGTDAPPWLLILDDVARVRWQRGGIGGADIDATWLGSGQILYGGTNGDIEHLPPTVTDLDGAVTWQAADVTTEPLEVADTWNHDAGLSADGDAVYALSAEQIPYGGSGETWRGAVIHRIEFADGQPSWSWSLSDHLAGSFPLEGDEPAHANAVWQEVAGGPVYLGLRNADQVWKIDASTGDVEWRLGPGQDFALEEADGTPADEARWFEGIHDAKVVDDRLYVFDNHELAAGAGVASRALALDLDEDARVARIAREWTASWTDWFCPSWGGVDPLDDGVLSIVGTAIERGHSEQIVTSLIRVDAEGSVTWRAEFPVGIDAYRTDWLPDFP
jgi:hypothetical protein